MSGIEILSTIICVVLLVPTVGLVLVMTYAAVGCEIQDAKRYRAISRQFEANRAAARAAWSKR